MVVVERSSFHVKTAIILFLNLKGTCSFNSKNRSQQLKQIYVAYSYPKGACCKELLVVNPFKFMANNFLLETGSVFCSGNAFPAIG
jgi:hypothetical protein